MPFDGSGNYTPAAAPNFPAVGGATISSTYYNAVINDLATAMSNTLTRDGQGKPSTDINWNAKSLMNVNALGAVSLNVSGNSTFTGTVGTGALTVTGALGASGTVKSGLTGFDGSFALARTSDGNTAATISYISGGTELRLNNGIGTGIITLLTNSVERLRVDSSGNIGIGTTTPADKLHVDAATAGITLGPTFNGGVAYNTGSRSLNVNAWTGTPALNLVRQGVNQLNLQVDSSGNSLFLQGGSTERMRIDTSGNLGIGTSSPGRRLHIYVGAASDIRARVENTVNSSELGILSTGEAFLTSGGTQPFIFYTNSAERMRIAAGGGLSIGYTSAPNTLNLGGSTQTGLTFNQSSAGADAKNWDFFANTTDFLLRAVNDAYSVSNTVLQANRTGTTINYVLLATGAGVERMRVDSSGNVTVGGTAPTESYGRTTLSIRSSGNGGLLEVGDAASGHGIVYYDVSANKIILEGRSTNTGVRLTATGTGAIEFTPSGASSGTFIASDGSMTSPNLANTFGYKGLPQNTQTANYTLVMGDQGKDIYITGTTVGQTVTIPANASVAFPVGTVIKISNDSNQNWLVAITTDTLVWKGSGATGTRTIAPQGDLVLEKKSATRWWCGGAGVS